MYLNWWLFTILWNLEHTVCIIQNMRPASQAIKSIIRWNHANWVCSLNTIVIIFLILFNFMVMNLTNQEGYDRFHCVLRLFWITKAFRMLKICVFLFSIYTVASQSCRESSETVCIFYIVIHLFIYGYYHYQTLIL